MKDDKSGVDLIFVLSDTHCGSTMGLCPPEVVLDGGGKYVANKIQRWMWECWEDATGCCWRRGQISMSRKRGWMAKVARGRDYAVILNGDLVEGIHHHNMEIVSPDAGIHSGIAAKVLAPIAEVAKAMFLVRGTESHVRTAESRLGLSLGARYCKETKDFCWEQLQIRVNGTLSHFKHHIGTALRPWTKSMQYAAALVSEQANAVALEHEVPRVIVRSHRHEYGEFRSSQGLIVVTPPWQMMTRFARKVTQASFSVPGVVALDYRDLDEHGLPRTHVRTYKPDADEVVEL